MSHGEDVVVHHPIFRIHETPGLCTTMQQGQFVHNRVIQTKLIIVLLTFRNQAEAPLSSKELSSLRSSQENSLKTPPIDRCRPF